MSSPTIRKMANTKYTVYLFVVLSSCVIAHNDDNVYKEEDNQPLMGPARPTRYLLFDVNPGEGFNLRRDVYMRVANLVKFLNEEAPWVLVLPPWGRLYHWQSRDLHDQSQIPWRNFFDIDSLKLHIPVMEFEDFLDITGKPQIDEVYYLQRFAEGWTKWEEKVEVRDCIEPSRYHEEGPGKWSGPFFGYNVFAGKFTCLSSQSYAASFKPFLLENTTASSVFLDRAEVLIHGKYSEWAREFWTARRSMVFAKHLREVGDQFREEFLESNDSHDKTELELWTQMKRNRGDAIGGPYLAVHLRRKDHLVGHSKRLPGLENAARQIKKYMKKFKLKKLYIATDAPADEYVMLKKQYLKSVDVYRYSPSLAELREYKDGGVAIIDQWICAHARAFVGSYVSTFSFRIHEEREIMGFDPATTYNRFCGDDEGNCEQPSQWKVVY